FCSYVVGYRRDYSGHVMFDETDTMSFTVKDWVNVRQRHISHLFQELRLFPELTALENVEIKNAITGFKSREEIIEWFDMLGIGDKLNAKIGRMSFGQQQRVAMIRALVQPFDFILVDEPISHLDDTNSDIMAKIMMTEAKAQGAGVIVTSIGKRMNLNYEKTFKL
ncbi:MAG: ATP-binding cassette domain-containing protein, partial [Segatella salivae]